MLLLGYEKFRPVNIEGYSDFYEISDYGTLRNRITGKILSKRVDKKGYSRACLIVNHKKFESHLAIVVGKTFPEICGEYFEGCEADHINGWRNDDRAVNIRFVSHKDNINNPVTNYRFKLRDLPQYKMSDSRKEKLRTVNSKPVASFDKNGNLVKKYTSISEAATDVNGRISNIGSVAGKKHRKGYDGIYRLRKMAYGYHWEFI